MSFKNLGLNKPILRAVAEAGYDNPTLVQEKTIPCVLEKKDVIVSAQTGTEKQLLLPCQFYNYYLTIKTLQKTAKKLKPL